MTLHSTGSFPPLPRRFRRLRLVLSILGVLLLLVASQVGAQGIPFEPGDSLQVLREKIAANGYQFTVGETWVAALPSAQREALRARGRIPLDPSNVPSLGMADAVPRRAVLPETYDWRNVNGANYISPVRNQGSCGSCYAFAAMAVAEGVYNIATRRTAASGADFSEQHLAFCLGTHGPYSANFGGCDGADYSYTELQALTVEGVTTEAAMPYTGADNQNCNQSSLPMTKFSGWGRAGCQDLTAIKNAILAYGPVDAAVLTTSAFDAYTGGVYQDTATTCPASDACYNTATDHAIVLVGWNDGNATTPGHWILRNSWGEDWGEDGYMRIAYDAARVSCAVAYLTYAQANAGFIYPILQRLMAD